MGSGMARNLVKQGYEVVAYDLNEEALKKARSFGCDIAGSAKEAVQDVNVVITMLPSGKHVDEVYRNDILPNISEWTLLIDCSTIDVETSRQVAESAMSLGYMMADAPVSGGTKGAENGTLTFMVGGTDWVFDEIKPILEAMGSNIFHAGANGAGQAAKVCNNMLLGASMVATCEAFNLATSLGLEPQTFFDIASKASGQTWSMTSYCPVAGVGPASPADNNFQGGFAAALMLKDLMLAKDSAESVGESIPMGKLAATLYQSLCDESGAGNDFSSIINYLKSTPC